MLATKGGPSDRQGDLHVFDEIIRRAFAEFCEGEKVNIKMGEFVMKAIKQKNDLTPQGSDQKEFWKMIEQIRKKNLAESPVSKSSKVKARKKTSTGRSNGK